MVWYSHLFHNFPLFIVIHKVKGFGIVNKAEIDVFLELSCFFRDPTDVGNLISCSSAFPKTSLNIWKFTVLVLLKPGLEYFKHYFTSERLLLIHKKMLRFLASGGEEFIPGPKTRLDCSELLCNKLLLKYKEDRESF